MHHVPAISHRTFFLLILIFGATQFSSAQTQVVFSDSTKITITEAYTNGFRTPTNIFSIGAGGLFHARIFGDWYLRKNDIAQLNFVASYGDGSKFGYYEEVNYARYLVTFNKEKHLNVIWGYTYGKAYVIKIPVVRKIKLAPRGSFNIGYWHPDGNKEFPLNPYQIGIGGEVSVSRFAELNSSCALARESRFFVMMTDCPLLLGSVNGSFGKMDIENYDTLNGHTTALGFRVGFEYRNFSNYNPKRRIGGYTAYLIIEKNSFFAFGNANSNYIPRTQDPRYLQYNNYYHSYQSNVTPSITDRLKSNMSIMLGFAYSFMKKVKTVPTDQTNEKRY